MVIKFEHWLHLRVQELYLSHIVARIHSWMIMALARDPVWFLGFLKRLSLNQAPRSTWTRQLVHHFSSAGEVVREGHWRTWNCPSESTAKNTKKTRRRKMLHVEKWMSYTDLIRCWLAGKTIRQFIWAVINGQRLMEDLQWVGHESWRRK